MNIRIQNIFGIILLAFLASCTEKYVPDMYPDAVEMEGLEAKVVIPSTKADINLATSELVGRSSFTHNDALKLTLIKRTDNPIPAYTYDSGVDYVFLAADPENSLTQGGWNKNDDTKIYWSDSNHDHTFIGYSVPQNASFTWSKDNGIYYGSIGDGTSSTRIDYLTNGNTDIAKDDLLITYSDEVKAQPGGSVAKLDFEHALSCIRVVANISNFSPSNTADDNHTRVSNMLIKAQPTLYKWEQDNARVTAKSVNADENCPRDILLSIPVPDGVGSNQSRRFTFYGLAVPGTRDVVLTFDVTYPDPLAPTDPLRNKTKEYKAELHDVVFESAYCTTINISLSHKDESIYIGAEFDEWAYVETPDSGELKKSDTFLSHVDKGTITIASDQKATFDDATWLYMDGETLTDIYGNTGDSEHPFVIKGAEQFLSFLYEVNSDRDFESKYIVLGSSIVLQKSLSITDGTSGRLDWPGIGSSEHPFNGHFSGEGRVIMGLARNPVFNFLGEHAVVSNVRLEEVLSLNRTGITYDSKTVMGALAAVNLGTVTSCKVAGKNLPSSVALTSGSQAYVGSIVGYNAGTVSACVHTGDIAGSASNLGGLVGYNGGTINASYNAGAISGSNSNYGIAAGNNGTITSCYFDSTLAPTAMDKSSYGQSTIEMQKQAMVTSLNTAAGFAAFIYKAGSYPALN